MVHVLASIAFTLVAFGSSALTAMMIATARGEILQALGITTAPVATTQRRPVRVRSAGRWQAASSPAMARPRAAA